MQSVNHQYVEFNDRVLKRYVRTTLQPITGYRLNPNNAVNPNERIVFVLATPERNVDITPYTPDSPTLVKQTAFSYEDEVLELYTDVEVRSFERMNRLLIENGILVPYDEQSPDINTSNVLSAETINKLVYMKQTSAFKAKVEQLTSPSALTSLLQALEENDDVKYAHIKFVKGRINELNSGKNT